MTIENNGLLLNSLTTNIGAASVKPPVNQGQDSFQSILSSTQSQKTEQPDNKNQVKNDKSEMISEKSSESKNATDKASENKDAETTKKADTTKTDDNTDDIKENATTQKSDDSQNVGADDLSDGLTDEELAVAMEIFSGALLNLVQDVAQELGITADALVDALDELKLSEEDLLDLDNLKAVFLNVKGVDDSMSLVTDENLYSQFAEVTEVVEKALEVDSEFDNKNIAELKEMISQAAKEMDSNVQIDKADAQVTVDVPVQKEESWTRKEGLDNALADEENVLSVSSNDAAFSQIKTDSSRQNNHHERGENHDESGNLMQNANNDMDLTPEPVANEVPVTTTTTFEQAQRIADQIMDQIRSMRKDDITTVEMQLHPATLGTLQINVANKGGVLTANFVTQNEAVKAALETQMVQLRESFEHQGIKVEAIEVSVATHSFEQNLEQEGHREENRESNSNGPRRVRRLQLGPDFGMDELENLDEADRLAAEMMAANGQTVDYQV